MQEENKRAPWKDLPTGYFTHDLTGEPNPLAGAPESSDRMEAIETRLIAGGVDECVKRVDCGPAPRDVVLLAHEADYVDALERAANGDPEALKRFDAPDMKVGPMSYAAAMQSAGAVVAAVDALLARTVRNAFCAIRPPGHHAGRARASGFCFLNNAAIGALYARQRGVERVAILDIDAHHADGTEEIIANEPGIRLYSLFQWPLFPDRRMTPPPQNVTATPLSAGEGGEALRRILETEWLPSLSDFRPGLILVSAGFDAHLEEQMAQLKLSEIDYAYATRRFMDAAEAFCEGRLLSVLEGGYSLRSLARSVLAHLQTLVRSLP